MSRLVLVRHGESTWNVEGRIQGNLDSGLSSKGRVQTERLAERLKGRPFAALYSSPLKRAEESAAILASAVNLPLCLAFDLREISLGTWEGKTTWELKGEYGDLYETWLTRPLEVTPPNGEGLVAFQKRVVTALEEIREAHPQQDLLIVTHAGVIRAYLSFILDLDLNRIFTLTIDNTAVNEVFFKEAGGSLTPTLCLLNDTCHLAGLDGSSPKGLATPVF